MSKPFLLDSALGGVYSLLDQFVKGAIDPEAVSSAILAVLAEIDSLLSNQLNEILHHPAFQKLEASWRGLDYLVRHTKDSDLLRIKIINATKTEWLDDARSSGASAETS